MRFTRRQLLQATALAPLAPVCLAPTQLNAASGRWDDLLMIDALGGTVVNEDGFRHWERSGVDSIETTLGARGTPTFSYEAAVRDIAGWQGQFTRHADRLIHVKSAQDVLDAKNSRRLGVMLGFQNGTHLDRNLDNIEFFYNLGIRQIQLTYNTVKCPGGWLRSTQ